MGMMKAERRKKERIRKKGMKEEGMKERRKKGGRKQATWRLVHFPIRLRPCDFVKSPTG